MSHSSSVLLALMFCKTHSFLFKIDLQIKKLNRKYQEVGWSLEEMPAENVKLICCMWKMLAVGTDDREGVWKRTAWACLLCLAKQNSPVLITKDCFWGKLVTWSLFLWHWFTPLLVSVFQHKTLLCILHKPENRQRCLWMAGASLSWWMTLLVSLRCSGPLGEVCPCFPHRRTILAWLRDPS